MLSAPDVPSSTPKHQLVGLAIRWCISHKLVHVVRHIFLPATLNTAARFDDIIVSALCTTIQHALPLPPLA
eukprot:11024993-Karenia_brevis.AAC.1